MQNFTICGVYFRLTLTNIFDLSIQCKIKRPTHIEILVKINPGGRTGLKVSASESGSGDPGSILGRVGVFVSLSKRHLLPKSTGNTQE